MKLQQYLTELFNELSRVGVKGDIEVEVTLDRAGHVSDTGENRVSFTIGLLPNEPKKDNSNV
jgi:hypothetical protein